MARVNLYIPDELLARLDKHCEKRGVARSSAICDAVYDALARTDPSVIEAWTISGLCVIEPKAAKATAVRPKFVRIAGTIPSGITDAVEELWLRVPK